MTVAIVQFVLAAAVIVVAGTFLARCADLIAEITRLGRLLIGSVLLAGATSLPELTVDISAVRMGLPDLAVGDLLGSSLMNLLILAILDLTSRSNGKMLSRTAAGHALSGTMSMSITALAGLAILAAPQFPDWSLLGISLPAWMIVAAYLLGVRTIFLDQQISAQAGRQTTALGFEESSHGEAAQPSGNLPPLWKPVVGFVAAAIAIVLAGPWLADSAATIAELSGLGSTFVGTTFVALSTSLPELVASLAALRLGALDLAIGNVFGSNTFNMILLAPLDLFQPGSLFAVVSPAHAISCLAVVLVTSVAIMGQLYHVERRRRLLEPDATLMIGLILATLALVYRASSTP